MDKDLVIKDLKLAERMVADYMMPEADATQFALRALTNDDTRTVLLVLCDGEVDMKRLTFFLPSGRLEQLIKSAETWINVCFRSSRTPGSLRPTKFMNVSRN